MHNIRWDLLPGVISQVLINIAIFTLVLTIFGAGILKYFVRTVPLLSHAILFFGRCSACCSSSRRYGSLSRCSEL